MLTNESASGMPVPLVCEGVLSRSVRDTAHFLAGAERYRRSRMWPPLGLIEAPARRRLRVGVLHESIFGDTLCAHTKAVLADTVALLESLGHRCVSASQPVGLSFVDDFADYWGMLAFLVSSLGRILFGAGFDASRLDSFTRGLAALYRRHAWRTPGFIYRLRRSWQQHISWMKAYDVVLSPVLGHAVAPLGDFGPGQPFEQLFERILRYVCFTPINNANGSPAIALPLGSSLAGLPLGMQFTAAHGDERTLLELAYELEQAKPWPLLHTA